MVFFSYNFKQISWHIFFLTLLILFGCSPATNVKENIKVYNSPPLGFPSIPFPDDNPYTTEKFELGRMLFYEPMLSKDSSIKSCSHCLKQAHSFADETVISLGFNGEAETRNTMSLANVAYRKMIFWDGRANKIEAPAYRSIFLKYILNGDTNEIAKRLSGNPVYLEKFGKAFGSGVKPSAFLASKAIATFVRCLVSGNSAYDKFQNGDKSALSESQIRGMNLFFSDKLKCSVCHAGFLFTDMKFHNTGVSTHYFDRGRYYVTGNPSDRGKFLTPTLRNIEVTAPYMHNGEIGTLEQVVSHYNRGGKPFINKDTILKPLNLSDSDQKDLVNFLKSLTDWEFLSNKDFSKP